MRRGRAVARPALAVLGVVAGVVLTSWSTGCGLPLRGETQGPREVRQAAWVESLRRVETQRDPGPTDSARCLAREDDAIAAALTQSPEAARFEGEARYLFARAEASPADAPELRLGNLRLDRLLHGPERAELALRVPIARPGTLDGERQLIRAEAGVFQARAQLERVRLALEVREAWARLDHARARATIAAELARRYARTGPQTELNALDRQAAGADALRAEAELAAQMGEVSRWQETLAALAGLPACDEPAPVVVGAAGAAERDTADEALTRRAELGRLFAEREQAVLAHALAERSAWPWFEWVQLGYEVDGGFMPDTFGFALSISLPFAAWDGAAAEAERVKMRAIDEEARRWVARIDGEVGAARRELDARLSQVQRVEALLAAMPAESIDALHLAAPTEVLTSDLLTLHRDRARLANELADARLAALLSRARLLHALGR